MNHRKLRIFSIIVSLCAIVALTAGTVWAYLSTNSGSLVNIFKPANDPVAGIVETTTPAGDEGIFLKEDVAVSVNNRGYAVYVRAAIIVNWEKDGASGTFHASKPVLDTDYEMTLNCGESNSAWFKNGEFYYHKAMIPFDGIEEATKNTAVLINTCKQLSAAPAGYHLNVQIVGQTIQALGTTDTDGTPAVTDAWGISVGSDFKLTP